MQGLMCLVQGHNAVTLVRLEPAALRSRVKHSTTEPLRSILVCVHLQLVCALSCASRVSLLSMVAVIFPVISTCIFQLK